MRTDTINTAYRSTIRIALVTAFILLIPLLAMQITDEVVWGLGDFAVAGALLFGTGLTYELIAKKRAILYIDSPSALRLRRHLFSSG